MDTMDKMDTMDIMEMMVMGQNVDGGHDGCNGLQGDRQNGNGVARL